MKTFLTIVLAGLVSSSALAQQPFVGLYAGTSMSKMKQFPIDVLQPVPVLAGRAEVGLSWLKKIEAGIQVNVQSWRLKTETVHYNGTQRVTAVETKVDYGAPAVTVLAFGRYTTSSGFRLAAGLGFSRAFGKGEAIRFENFEEGGGIVRLPTYVQGVAITGYAASLQAGYKHKLTGPLSVGLDAAATYSAMRTYGTYGMFCFSATAGVQYSF